MSAPAPPSDKTPDPGEWLVKSFISVYWPGERQWFDGKVRPVAVTLRHLHHRLGEGLPTAALLCAPVIPESLGTMLFPTFAKQMSGRHCRSARAPRPVAGSNFGNWLNNSCALSS